MTLSLQRTALVLLATTALTACASTTDGLRPSYPIREAEAPPPVAEAAPAAPAVEDAPLPQSRPAPVESRPLEQLPPARAAEPPPAPEPPRRAAPPPAPSYRTVTTRAVTGKVVDVAGKPSTYTVRKGDTLASIARKLDTDIDQLKDDNRLKKSTIQPGQVLKGPSSSAKAYVVGQGDTLFSIGRRFGVTAEALRDENDLGRNAALRTGQRVRLPDGFRDKGPIVSTSRVQVGGSAAAEPEAADEAPTARAPAAPRAATPAPAPGRSGRTPQTATQPAYRIVTTRSVTGRVVEVEGKPATYTVKKGDNLEKIARKLDTTVDALKDDNDLRRSTIRPGQRLKGPREQAKAYVAGSGDTLANIARRFGVTEAALRAENGLSRNAGVKSGQRVRLPDGFRDKGALTTTTRVPIEVAAPEVEAPPPTRPEPPRSEPPRSEPPRSEPPRTEPPRVQAPPPAAEPAPALPSRPQPYRSTNPPTQRPYTPPPSRSYTPPPGTPSAGPPVAPTAAPPVSDAQISQLGRGRFVWPVRGDVVSNFGAKPGAQRNDGINIRGASGDSVRAASAGEVVYAGDQVPGFGNLVLIKHPDGWVTAYGHLSRIEVKMQQKVSQGQQIGQVGATGGVPEPQLHFEVRYAPSPMERARPVDPELVLPR